MTEYFWHCKQCGYSKKEKTKPALFLIREEIDDIITEIICPDCGEELINLNEG